jgi:anti-anti-sigma factor
VTSGLQAADEPSDGLGPPLASISVVRSGGSTLLAAAGEIDMSNHGEFRAALATAASGDQRLVVDLTGVTTLSSHAIGVLYRHADSLTAVYVERNSLIARALSYSGFASRVPVIADRPR